MLRWWRSVGIRMKVLIILVLVIAGCAVMLSGLAALRDEQKPVSASTPTGTVVPPRTLTTTKTLQGLESGAVTTVTITEPARTVPITPLITQASGGDPDNTIAIALISAGALIIGSAITATTTVLVARGGKHT
jgi:hypothetical protein